MGATYAKIDANCTSEILFIGTTGLRAWVSPPPPPPQCDAELYIDVIVPTAYTNVEFDNVNLFLEIKSPVGAMFVPDPRMGSGGGHWGVPDGSSWDESLPGSPTARVRLRNPHAELVRGGLDGLSFWVAVSGVTSGSTLSFTAAATADRILAATASCPIEIKDLAVGEQLTGYLDR
ncbi:hypothetical protein [Streptomyces alanosinicus]|uniref:Uncharacterized protein n=1 Tax=Streptomyces alanosinicus TaxID=68171 RepID=A0A918YLU1_9ACTN|nr:hypothetical protein [Streptomyces alanosinicus]GHE07177.1 hypothetical protein GCM10010339_51230 [Streptomyces alanosinicus]